MDQVTEWAEQVKNRKVLVGKYVRLACLRHLKDQKEGPKRGLFWDDKASEKAIKFFSNLKHSKGQWAGKPFALSPWQAFIVGTLMGWKNADKTRRFRVAYNEIPRKNGKSTLAAGLSLLLAFFDGEMGAEVYCAATKREQAKIVFTEARRMVDKTPLLKKRIQSLVGNLSIAATGSKLQPLGADADSTDGLNPNGVIIDELHAHKSAALVDVLQSAAGSRAQPMRFEITTAGHDRTSVCWAHHEYSVRVLEGLIEDDSWFGFIASMDPEDDWKDPTSWAKANLNLGISVFPQYLAAECKRATEIPSEQNTFKRLHGNIWTEQAHRWIDTEKWDANNQQPRPEGPMFMGLDMASTQDLTACVQVFGPDEDGYFDVLPLFWMPSATLAANKSGRSEADRLLLSAWADQGYIEVTEGDTTDYDIVEARILEQAEKYDLRELGHDRWNATQLVTHIKDALGTNRVTAIPQTVSELSAPSKELEKLIISGRIRHGGNPVLRWMASNVSIRHGRDGYIKPDRDSSRDKIDGIVALIMALRCATANGNASSVYDSDDRPDGLLTFGGA